MNKLLSVVIPVYKVEKYINKCLDSLIVSDEQMALLDIVIVNDGTPDNSANIAREYETKYPSVIRVIDQANRGHGGAWNHGTELAAGKYLYYLDSDDWFETSEFSRLIEYLKSCDTDMVLIDGENYHVATNTYERKAKHDELEPDRIYDVDKFDWIATGHGWNMTYAHDTIYRTTMMQQFMPIFCEHVMYDDVSLQVIPIAIAKDFVFTPLNVYRYYIGRPGQSFDPKVRAKKASHDVGEVLKFVLDWITRYRSSVPQCGTRMAWVDENYQSMGTWHYRELCEFSASVARPCLKEWDEFLRANYPDIRPNWWVRWYQVMPFPCFFYGFKAYLFYERVIRYLKRKLHYKSK